MFRSKWIKYYFKFILAFVVIIIIIIIILVITFMQGIYNYTLKQAMFLRNTVLQLFCIYNLCYM